MPLYEFQCAKCGRVDEFLLKYGEMPEENCPKCGGGKWQKIMSASARVQSDGGDAGGGDFGGCLPSGGG